MLRVIRNHRRAAHGESRRLREGLSILAGRARRRAIARTRELVAAARQSWDAALALGEKHGFRNAQATVHRADRHDRAGHGLRHDRHRARFRAGQIQEARRRRLFQDHQPRGAAGAADARLRRRRRSRRSSAMRWATARSRARPRINHESLSAKGFDDTRARRRRGRARLRLRHQIRVQQMDAGRSFLHRAARASRRRALDDPGFDLLAALGFTRAEIDAANTCCCGAMTLEGAPHLKPEHLPVFDCANPCGRTGKRACRSKATSA